MLIDATMQHIAVHAVVCFFQNQLQPTQFHFSPHGVVDGSMCATPSA